MKVIDSTRVSSPLVHSILSVLPIGDTSKRSVDHVTVDHVTKDHVTKDHVTIAPFTRDVDMSRSDH